MEIVELEIGRRLWELLLILFFCCWMCYLLLFLVSFWFFPPALTPAPSLCPPPTLPVQCVLALLSRDVLSLPFIIIALLNLLPRCPCHIILLSSYFSHIHLITVIVLAGLWVVLCVSVWQRKWDPVESIIFLLDDTCFSLDILSSVLARLAAAAFLLLERTPPLSIEPTGIAGLTQYWLSTTSGIINLRAPLNEREEICNVYGSASDVSHHLNVSLFSSVRNGLNFMFFSFSSR